jgi:hypothetical protein
LHPYTWRQTPQPAGQTCAVANASGTVLANVMAVVTVACT